MATKTKTIEFISGTVTSSLTSNTNRDVAIDIYIPEGDPTFTSCSLQVGVQADITNTFEAPVLGISTDGVTFTESTLANQANSNEVAWHHLRADVTAYFVANFDGATPPTSTTWTVRFRAPSDISINHTFKLLITYDYDDTDTTQIKTVRIPIASTILTSLTTSYQDLGGTTSIPAIGGAYLPEASVTVRQVWLELFAASGNTGNLTGDVRVNSTTEYTWCTTTSTTSAYAQHMYGLVDITAQDLTVARKLEAKSTLTNTISNLGGFICVTYEFNASTTTSVLNSLMMPIPNVQRKGMTTTQGNASTLRFSIQEPTPVLVESAVVARFDYDDVIITVGSQTSTEYPATLTNQYAGDYTFVHRFDGAAAKSAGFTLARGDNDMDLSWSPDDTVGSAAYQWLSMYMVINYTSGVHAEGLGAHNHSVYTHLRNNLAASDDPWSAPGAAIAETNYFMNGVMSDLTFLNGSRPFVSLQPQRLMAEGIVEYVRTAVAFTGTFSGAGESSTRLIYLDHTADFMRHPLDQRDQLMDVTTTRNWRQVYEGTVDPHDAVGLWTTYHSCTYPFDIAVIGYTGDGSGITFYVYRVDTNVLVATATTATGGTASGVAYDDLPDYQAVAQQGVLAGASLEVTL